MERDFESNIATRRYRESINSTRSPPLVHSCTSSETSSRTMQPITETSRSCLLNDSRPSSELPGPAHRDTMQIESRDKDRMSIFFRRIVSSREQTSSPVPMAPVNVKHASTVSMVRIPSKCNILRHGKRRKREMNCSSRTAGLAQCERRDRERLNAAPFPATVIPQENIRRVSGN